MWSSLPEAFELLNDPSEAVPLLLVPKIPDTKLYDWDHVQASSSASPTAHMSWPALYGLSMLARYEPDRWVSALQYDASSVSAGLAQLLDVAYERLPSIVLDGLNGQQTAYVVSP
jgi:hypothetical protein